MTGSFFSGAGRTRPKMVHSLCRVRSIEKPDATDGDGHGRAGVVFDVLDDRGSTAAVRPRVIWSGDL